jgi:hypothetical protein
MVRTPGWARIVDGVLRRDCRLRAVARLDLFAQGPAAQEDDAQQHAWQRRAQTAARNGAATSRYERVRVANAQRVETRDKTRWTKARHAEPQNDFGR